MKPSSFVQSGEFFTKLHRSVAFRVITMSHWKQHTKHDNGHYLLNGLVLEFDFRSVYDWWASCPTLVVWPTSNRPFEPISGSVSTRVKWLTGVISHPHTVLTVMGGCHFATAGISFDQWQEPKAMSSYGEKEVKSRVKRWLVYFLIHFLQRQVRI